MNATLLPMTSTHSHTLRGVVIFLEREKMGAKVLLLLL